jgi:hypothetical protein
MTDRFTEQVRRILDLARAEADRLGHRYVGPEHLVLGLLRDGGNPAARILQARGVDLAAARAALRRLADRGVVPDPRPSDAELLGTLGIDLEAIRRDLEQSFGVQALEQATREAVRARRRGVGRVPRTPLQGPPMLTVQATWLASQQAKALGYGAVSPELLLLGVLDDITGPWPRCMSNRRRRRLLGHLGLPTSYRGSARPLLEYFAVDLDELWDALVARLQGIPR